MSIRESIVYIVDDDEAVRQSLEWLLGTGEFTVRAFASATEFLREVDPKSPGCLIVDVRMPGMSGFELSKELTARAIDLPVIVITGHSDSQTAARAAGSGVRYVLEKPLDDTKLLKVIYEVLEKAPPDTNRDRH